MPAAHDDWHDDLAPEARDFGDGAEDDAASAFVRDDDRPRWTVKRVIYLLIALVLIALLVVYTVLPALQVWLYPPPPQPLAPPLNL